MFAVETGSGLGYFSLSFSSSRNVPGRGGPNPTADGHKQNLIMLYLQDWLNVMVYSLPEQNHRVSGLLCYRVLL